jgi:hypothetical protein
VVVEALDGRDAAVQRVEDGAVGGIDLRSQVAHHRIVRLARHRAPVY